MELEIFRNCKIKNVKKFFYFSVLQVYGRELIGKITENSKINCDNDYSLTHYLAENICEKYSKTINTEFSNMRLGYMFGCPIDKKIDRKTLIPFIFCKQAIEEKEITLASKGKHEICFPKNTGLIIEKIIKKIKNFEILNFVSGFLFQ